MATYKDALALHEQGWQIVPAKLKEKLPMTVWKSAQSEKQAKSKIRDMFGGQERNIFLITGSTSGLVVLDCDDSAALAWWGDRLGDVMEKTTAVTSGKGVHYYFRIPVGESHKGRAQHGGVSGNWDFRADGGGVIAPPSLHPEGRVYAWMDGRGPEAIQDAPPALWEALEEIAGKKGKDGLEGSNVVSTLAGLLENPPLEGGRNEWLIRVCGHYAKMTRFPDAYNAMARSAAEKINPPLSEAEIAKTLKSGWDMEQAKPIRQSAEPVAENGYIVASGSKLLVQVKTRDSEGSVSLDLAEFMDASLIVNAKIVGEEWAREGYDIRIERVNGEVTESVDLPTTILGDSKRLTMWMTQQGIGYGLPPEAHPKGFDRVERLRRYLNAQGAPVQRYVTTLGWHDEAAGYICPDGIIDSEGKQPLGGWRPHPALESRVPYRYGIPERDDLERGPFTQARDALREIMEFHDSTVCAVFGSWWAACFIKPQLMDKFSQFPVMALEAPSESGKSTGFFPMMMELSGAMRKPGIITRAALRDFLASHKNGIVWMDDLDDLEEYGELIRSVTVGSDMTKKGADQTTQKSVKLEGALCLTGEALGLDSQKALMDRVVALEVPSPVDRMSTTHPGESQWEDIMRFRAEVDPLDHAGTFLWMAAKIMAADGGQRLESAMARAKADGGKGRFADKMAVIRTGCWLLSQFYGDGAEWISERVEKWILEESLGYDPRDNALTTQILPAALAAWDVPRRPHAPDPAHRQTATPAFVGGKRGRGMDEMGRVWFSPIHLAEWWKQHNRGNIQQRVASESALKDQAHRCGIGSHVGKDQKRFQFVDSKGGANYWGLDEEMSAKVIARAEGLTNT